MKRRSVLKAGLATSLIPLLGFSGFAKAFDLQNRIQLKAILSDRRFPISSAFGLQAAAMGIPHLISNGDITAVWLKHLDPLWREGKASVMGLTTLDQLFCLERLAWDRGMKVLIRVEHRDVGLGDIAHKIEAPPLLAEKSALAVQSGSFWPRELATLLGSCSHSQFSDMCANREVTSKGKLGEQLVSWVIAPANRAA
jgi:hypothetical protein